MPKEMVALIQKPEVMAAIIGAIAAGMITGMGWTVTTAQKHRHERREAERVQAREAQLLSEARSREVLFACKHIRDLLGVWLDRIYEATQFEDTPEKTRAKLRRFQEGHFFQTRLKECTEALEAVSQNEPECRRLINLTGVFHSQVYEIKGDLSMILNNPSYSDYNAHREEARKAIAQYYDQIVAEADRLIQLLNNKVGPSLYFIPGQHLLNQSEPV
jgi:hypothetical protein